MNGLCPAWWLPRWWWNLSRLWREVYNNRTAGILPSERALFYFLFNCVWILRRLHHHRPLSSFSFMPILRLISMVLYNLILVSTTTCWFLLDGKIKFEFERNCRKPSDDRIPSNYIKKTYTTDFHEIFDGGGCCVGWEGGFLMATHHLAAALTLEKRKNKKAALFSLSLFTHWTVVGGHRLHHPPPSSATEAPPSRCALHWKKPEQVFLFCCVFLYISLSHFSFIFFFFFFPPLFPSSSSSFFYFSSKLAEKPSHSSTVKSDASQ